MTWFQRLFRRGELEAQLERELRFHLDEHTRDLIAQGVPPREARRQAQLALGGAEQVKEGCRDARGTRWLEDIGRDVRYAFRMLRGQPAFAATALLTLSLGAGATTVMFTLLDGVLLKPLPYADPSTLLKIDEQTKGVVDYRWGDRWAFAYPNFLDCRREVPSLEMAAFRFGGGTLSGSGDPEFVNGLQISAELLPMLRVTPVLGRPFTADEDRPGAPPVIVIGYSLWQRRFGRRPSVVGESLTFEGKPHTIVGVTPASFDLVDAEAFTPIGQNTLPVMSNRQAHPGIGVWARLRPGATRDRAQAELDVVGRRLADAFPDSNKGRGFIAEPLRAEVGSARGTLWVLSGAVALVLLIACVNVASLLLARAVSRDHELAMRAALGAGRGRLARQLLTESVILGLCGGALGVLVAALSIRPFVAVWPEGLPRSGEVGLDWRVLLFTMSVSILCGVLFGLAPVLRARPQSFERALRVGGRAVSPSRLHAVFVVAQIAVAMVLLVSAGLLGRTLLRLSSLDPGVDLSNVLTSRMALSPAILADPGRTRAAWADVLERARRVPGVRAVAMVDTVPMREGNFQIRFATRPGVTGAERPLALANSVTPEYLTVMGLRLRRGRFIDDHDRLDTTPVVVIDEVLAQQAFGAEDPIGRKLWTDLGPAPLEVVGVVGHVRYWGLAADDQAAVRRQMYYPFAQVVDANVRRWSELMSIAVRTTVDPLTIVSPLRHELRGAANDQVLYETRTLEQLARATLARQRFLLVLFAAFASLALTLACIGTYGVLAYLARQRVREFGVRIALGASPNQVVRQVFGQSVRMTGAGALLGAVGTLAAARVLQQLIEGVTGIEPVAFAAMTGLLVAAALCAGLVPARRAGRVDPITALRQE
jgi:putative ABC transport system permease protein